MRLKKKKKGKKEATRVPYFALFPLEKPAPFSPRGLCSAERAPNKSPFGKGCGALLPTGFSRTPRAPACRAAGSDLMLRKEGRKEGEIT